MVEAIDDLSRKVESLTHTVSSMARGSPDGSGRGGSVGSGMCVFPSLHSPRLNTDGDSWLVPSGEPRAAAMEKHLQDLVSTVNDLKESGAGSSSTGNEQHSESLTHLLQLQDRLMVELKAFGHKLDNSNVSCPLLFCSKAELTPFLSIQSASSASLSTLTSRTSELLTLLKQASSDFEKATSIQWTKYLYGSLGLVSGALLMRWREKARRDDVWGTTTRKML